MPILILVAALLSVIPAYADIVKTFPNGYVNFTGGDAGNRDSARQEHGIERGINKVPARDEYWLVYWIRLNEGWVEGAGGKLPGLAGGNAGQASGCNSVQADAWSARLMWGCTGMTQSSCASPPQGMGLYLYWQDRVSTCGTRFDFSDSTQLIYRVGQWQQLVTHVKINDPDVANGIVEWWSNGIKVVDMQNARLRGSVGSSTARVDTVFFDVFRGGGQGNLHWATENDTRIDFSTAYLMTCMPKLNDACGSIPVCA